MTELAYNINGETFDVPETATGWRVRRMKPRGAPEVVFGRDGLPLVVPIESDLEDLRRSVGAPGRFRLDAADERGRDIEGVPASYVVVPNREEPAAQTAPATGAPVVTGTDSIIAEAMRLNTELAKSVIDRFPEMMQAAAELLRAADGAGLPARTPREIEADEDDDEDTDDEIAAPPGFDLNAIVAQIVPVLVTGLMSGKMKVPGLASLFDWRKAVPAAAPAPAPKALTGNAKAKAAPAVAPAPTDAPQDAPAIPALDPAALAHVLAIQSALEPGEVAFVQEVAKELSPAELRAWFDKLGALSVPEAVETIRGLIAGKAKTGGAL